MKSYRQHVVSLILVASLTPSLSFAKRRHFESHDHCMVHFAKKRLNVIKALNVTAGVVIVGSAVGVGVGTALLSGGTSAGPAVVGASIGGDLAAGVSLLFGAPAARAYKDYLNRGEWNSQAIYNISDKCTEIMDSN